MTDNNSCNEEMINYVKHRTGHIIQSKTPKLKSSWWKKITRIPNLLFAKIKELYLRTVLLLLPSAFRQQNVSHARVGERHAWMYDYYTVEQLLIQVGFIDVVRMTATTSGIQSFPNYPLDVNEDGEPRKGSESMYIEAVKP